MAAATYTETFELNRPQLTELLAKLDAHPGEVTPQLSKLREGMRATLRRKRWRGTATITVTSKRQVDDALFADVLRAFADVIQLTT